MKKLIIILFALVLIIKGAPPRVPDFDKAKNYVHNLHHWMAGYYRVFNPTVDGITSCGHITACFANNELSYYYLNFLNSMTAWIQCLASNSNNFLLCLDEAKQMTSFASKISSEAVCWSKVTQMKGIYTTPAIFFEGKSSLTNEEIISNAQQSMEKMDLAFGQSDIQPYRDSGKFFGLIAQSYLKK